MRHGLTGQTVVLPGEDLAAYGSHCERCRSHYKPKGHEESQLVQTISDSEWV